jgi:hypothetical protein
MSRATTAIITKGLSSGRTKACENGSVITSFFGLYCGYIKDSDFPGSVQPPPQPPSTMPDDVITDPFRTQPKIHFFVEFNGKKYDIEYNINDARGKMVVRIINIIASGKKKLKVIASKLHVKNKLTVKMTNWFFRNFDK